MQIKKIWYTAALSCVSLVILFIVVSVTKIYTVVQTSVQAQEPYILIDPGHGGEDGGAQASEGTLEKNINLAISLPLRDVLKFLGYEVKMTRDTDISIHSADAQSIKNKKVSDMKNRLKMYNDSMMTISIHQNHFPATQYFGTQIFYSSNHPASQAIANSIRSCVLEKLQPENKRELKKGGSEIYLLNKTFVPAVLVECGFLSNETERDKLKSPDYQKKMALAIACGVLEYSP